MHPTDTEYQAYLLAVEQAELRRQVVLADAELRRATRVLQQARQLLAAAATLA